VEGPVKERLTGALILVAALVIIVPEMLSGPGPRAASSAATLPQPADAGAPLRTYSVVLNGSAGTDAIGQATPVAQPVAAPVLEATAPVAPPAAAAPLRAAGTQEATDAPSSAVTNPPVAAEPAKPAVSSPSATGNWWAQLGSFSAHDNADRLVQKLRAQGYAMDMSKVSAAGKELYRVRAGPVRSRMEAQALQARLAAAGHKSSIVAP
jgi:DedD protein